MGLLQRWRAWRRSPSEAERRAAFRRVLDELPLSVAERIVAAWLGQEAIDTGDVDRYTTEFVARRAGWSFGDHTVVHPTSFEALRGEDFGERAVLWLDVAELAWVRAGTLELFVGGVPLPQYPSAAHAAIDGILAGADAEAVHALARDPAGVGPLGPPALEWHRPREPVVAPWAVHERMRPWVLVAFVAFTLLGVGLAWLGVSMLEPTSRALLGFACIMPGGWMTVSCTARVLELLFGEPRARRLALTERGFLHPRTREVVSWSDVRLTWPWRRVAFVLADGLRVAVPLTAFRHPEHAAWWLARHVGRAQAPYRGR